MTAAATEKMLRVLLKASGLVLMLALPAALMPTSWMQRTNDLLLHQPLAATPLAEYLTRSLSGLYASLGLVTWFLATDVRRYAPVIACKSVAGMLFAIGIFVLDLSIGLPWYWTAVEGPGIFVLCAAGLFLARRVGRSATISPTTSGTH